MQACWIWPAATAVIHGSSRRAAAVCGRSIATLRRLPRLRGNAGRDDALLDLETGGWPFGGERFDAIVVTNYLHRPLFAHLLDALADDGVLIYETFAQGNEAYGRPSNPDHLLRAGELVERIAGRLADRRLRGRARDGRRARAPSSSGSRRSAAPTWSRKARRRRRRFLTCSTRSAAANAVKSHLFAPILYMLTGSLVAIATPMQEGGALDLPALGRLIDFHVANGTSGIVIVGTTGESPTVDVDEHCQLITAAVEFARGRSARHRRNRRQFDGGGDRAHRVREEGRRQLAAFRSSRTTTSRRRKGSTAISARSPKRSTCR